MGRRSRECLEADQLERRGDLARDLARGDPPLLEAEGDVPRDRHVRPQRVGLEHHADVALPRRQVRDVLAVDADLAAVGC